MSVSGKQSGTKIMEENVTSQTQVQVQVEGKETREKVFTFKKLISKYLSSSAVHGLGKIQEANRFSLRLIWVLVFMGFFGFLLYDIVYLFQKLLKHETRTKTQTFHYLDIKFPAVTVCNKNFFRWDDIKKRTNFDKMFENKLYNETYVGISEGLHYDYFIKLTNTNVSDLEKAGQSLKDFLLIDQTGEMPYCYFGAHMCDFKQHFKLYSAYSTGNCATFNWRNNLTQNNIGSDYGFHVLLNLQQSTYNEFPRYQDGFAGVEVYIHEPEDEFPTFTEAVLASPGEMTRISLKEYVVKRLKHPYPDKCENRKNGVFTVSACDVLCLIDHQIKRCQAVYPVFKSFALKFHDSNDFRVADWNNSSDKSCIKETEQLLHSGVLKCNCPLPCHEKVFYKVVSHAMWPTKKLSKRIDTMFNSERFNFTHHESIYENLVALEIYFADFLIEETIHEAAYGYAEFLSELGGQMSLFIGASLFSIFEFIHFLFCLIRNEIKRIGKKVPTINTG